MQTDKNAGVNQMAERMLGRQLHDGRSLVASMDSVQFYRINFADKTMYVPQMNVLRANPVQISYFVAAVQMFDTCDFNDKKFDWDHLNIISVNVLLQPNAADLLHEAQRRARGTYVGIDIETKDLSWEGNKLLAIGLAVTDDTAYCFYNIPHSFYPTLAEVLADKEIRFVWHSGKFDTSRLRYCCHITGRVDEDTMLYHYVRVDEKKGTHGLKDLGCLYLQAPRWDDELENIKRSYCKAHKVKLSDFKYDSIPSETLVPYMGRDCIATRRLLKELENYAEPDTDWIYRKLIKLSNVFAEIESEGIMLDAPYMKTLGTELNAQRSTAELELQQSVSYYWKPLQYMKDSGAKSFPSSFNMNSPKQLKWMLEVATQSKLSSTDAATITELCDEVDRHEFDYLGEQSVEHLRLLLNGILRVRKLNKYIDTYVTSFDEMKDSNSRIHGTYNLHGTETGRLSSTEPNMQQCPRDKMIKSIFIAKPGYTLVQLDYSQAELRVLGVVSHDEFLIESYKQGLDLHANVARKIFGDDFTSEQRTMCKTINFGIAYGRGASAIATAFKMKLSEAQAIIDDWFAAMPGVKAYINNKRREARRGVRQQTVFGRVRHFVVTDENMFHIENEYINTPIQSIASDCTLLSILEITEWLQENKLDAKIVMTVHDSIILEVRNDFQLIQTVAEKCKCITATVPERYMKERGQVCPLPFKADVEVGGCYGHLQDYEEWFAERGVCNA